MKFSTMKPNFRIISPELAAAAEECWRTDDPGGLMVLVGHQDRVRLLCDNIDVFRSRGWYEKALIAAYIHGPYMRPADWRHLFDLSDPKRLRDAGDAIPPGKVIVYRGIRHSGHRGYIRGTSWTTNPNTAAWFATRHAGPIDAPAVYSITVESENILFATDDRSESEIVIAVWRCGRVKRIHPMPESIHPSGT